MKDQKTIVIDFIKRVSEHQGNSLFSDEQIKMLRTLHQDEGNAFLESCVVVSQQCTGEVLALMPPVKMLESLAEFFASGKAQLTVTPAALYLLALNFYLLGVGDGEKIKETSELNELFNRS